MQARKEYSWILKAAVSIGVLVGLWFLVDVHALRIALSSVTLSAAIIVLALIPLSMGLRALRFWRLLDGTIPFSACWRIALVGETLNIILPASTGDLAKAYYGVREHGRKEEIVMATILDKVSGLLGLLLLGSIAAILHGYVLLGIAFTITTIVGCVFYLVPNSIPWKLLTKIMTAVKPGAIDVARFKVAFSGAPKRKYVALGISIVAWLVSYVHLYLITRLFGLHIAPYFLASVAPLMNLSRLFPFAFAGLGVQEGVTASLFGLVGVPAAIAIAVSLVYTVCTTVLPGLAGLYYILKMKKKV